MKSVAVIALRPSINIVLRPSVLIGVVYAALLLLFAFSHGYSALDFVHLGAVWSGQGKAGSWGYDGQFYYQLARDPLKAYLYMDNAPYRYQRIVYPLVVSFMSMLVVPFIPYILLLVNGLAVVLSVEILARLLVKRGLSPWFSLAAGLYFGQAAAFTFDTAEPFTFFLICAALWLLEGKRIPWAALLMGLAALSRETAIIFAVGYVAFFLLRKQWRNAAIFATLGVLPLLLWLLLLYIIFGKTGLTFAPPFEHSPFAGLFYFSQTPHKFVLLLVLMFIPTLGSCLLAAMEILRRPGVKSRQQLALLGIWLAHLAMIIFLSHYSYLELVSCGRVASGVVIAGLLYGISTRNRLILWAMQYYSLTFLIYLLAIFLAASSFIM